MRILFMGTPDFAVASLKRLVEDGHEVCGVFTQPDKPKNRGHKLAFSPVKEYSLTQELPVYQPLKMRDGEAMSIVEELSPELIAVAAYGKILPEDILNFPKYGSINVHSSLLPKTAWGWKCQGYEKFPLLIKFIDAKKNLSIQVHPGDDYALLNEGEYGKNEMWYIMEAKPGACLWCGFNRPITKAEIRERVQNGTLMEVLNRVPVQKGDTMMIPAGTVHAIGEGLVICLELL